MHTPYFHKQRKTWFVWLGKGHARRQVNLGKDKDAAWARYHELMLGQDQEITPAVPVVKLLDEYLCWVERHRKPETLQWYLHQLKPFSRFIGRKLTVAELKAHHITRFVEKQHANSRPSTIHGAIRAISRAFNWAIREEYLTRNPVAKVEKPTPTRREQVLSEEQFAAILERASDQEEHDLWLFLWTTGARIQEAIRIEARHVHLDEERIVIPASEGKKQLPRAIYLPAEAIEIVRRLVNQQPAGPIFRNSRGEAWDKNSVKCRFRKYKIKGLCATVFRHSWVTRSLIAGIDPVTLSVLAGHRNLTMIANNYSHLAQNPTYLKEQLKKLTGSESS